MADEMFFLTAEERNLLQGLLTAARSNKIGALIDGPVDYSQASAPILLAKLPTGTHHIPKMQLTLSGRIPGKVECELFYLAVQNITSTDLKLTALDTPSGPYKIFVYNPYPVPAVFLEHFRIQRLAGGGFICEPPKPFLAKPTTNIPKSGTGTVTLWDAGDGASPASTGTTFTDVRSHLGAVTANKFVIVTPVNGNLLITSAEC